MGTIDLELEDAVDHDHQAHNGLSIGNETFNDDDYALIDGNKKNEPIQNTPIGLLTRCKTGAKAITPSKKSKATISCKTSNDTTSGKTTRAKDPCKDPPTLVAGASPQSHNAFAAAFAESSATKINCFDQFYFDCLSFVVIVFVLF